MKKLMLFFLNLFATEGDCILLEAMPSMQSVKKYETAQAVWLNSKADMLGWDIQNPYEDYPELAEMASLDLKVSILNHKISLEKVPSNREKLKEGVKKICKEVNLLTENLDLARFMNLVKKTLKSRTESMIQSIGEAKGMYSRTFLLAGQNHLFQENIVDPELSITEFYDAIKSRNIIILKPKEEVIFRFLLGDLK